MAPVAELAHGEKSCSQSINQSVSHSPTYLIPGNQSFCFRTEHLSYDDCLEDKREDYQNCSTLYYVLHNQMDTDMSSYYWWKRTCWISHLCIFWSLSVWWLNTGAADCPHRLVSNVIKSHAELRRRRTSADNSWSTSYFCLECSPLVK